MNLSPPGRIWTPEPLKLPPGKFTMVSWQVCWWPFKGTVKTWPGQLTTLKDLWHLHQRLHAAKPSIDLDASDLPTLLELEASLKKPPIGKACGLDGLPAELLHASSPYLARMLWPLLLKITSRIQEPLQWKGGRLVALYKGKHIQGQDYAVSPAWGHEPSIFSAASRHGFNGSSLYQIGTGQGQEM